MRVLMLGWEYPPHISGGLGTACEGLTRALARAGVEIEFVVPHLYGGEDAAHMQLVDPDHLGALSGLLGTTPERLGAPASRPAAGLPLEEHEGELLVPAGPAAARPADSAPPPASAAPRGAVRTRRVPSALLPYLDAPAFAGWMRHLAAKAEEIRARRLGTGASVGGAPPLPPIIEAFLAGEASDAGGAGHYGSGLFTAVARFAQRTLQAIAVARCDLVHAHDWMTYPAGVAAARLLGVPLVVHVHSLEFDRSGASGNPTIIAIEHAGLEAADRVIAVSHYTKRLVQRQHGIPGDKIDVVHNGIYAHHAVASYREEFPSEGPMVLFLGRVTFQKGPDYFVEAAARVVPHVPNVRFVLAGTGDMLPRIKARVAELGLSERFEYPGFVRGPEVERLFSTADVYVMPSVSEPFGITALEAMSCDTPVILSRQSGAAEMLRHALKVDFWDVDRLASHVIAVLKYPELRESIVHMAREEVRRAHWDAAAQETLGCYGRLLGGA